MAYNKKDHYYYKAKEQNYAARSIFKLEEIDSRFKVFKTGQKVFDLGAAPGSWSQYASQKIGASGRILGVDLEPIQVRLENADFFKGDLREQAHRDQWIQVVPPPYDVVMSDMAPKTTGIRETDQARSLVLCELAFSMAQLYLREGGTFICKNFHSGEFQQFRSLLQKSFVKLEILRPKSTRKESKEIFFIGLKFKKN